MSVVKPNYRTLYNVRTEEMLKRHKTDLTNLFQGLHAESPFCSLIGKYGVMTLIIDFTAPTLDKKDFYYTMDITTCAGPCCMTYNMHMEKLACMDQFGVMIKKGVTLCGSIMNDPLNGYLQFHTKPFLKLYAWYQDLKGNFLNEGQLRELWRDLMKLQCTNNECGGMCCVLMGDTVHWIDKRSRRYPKAVPESKWYQSATQGDIIERGLLNWGPNGPGGRFAALARVFRDSPGELETAIQQASRYKSDSNATTYTSHRGPPYTVGSLGDGGQLLG